MPWPRFKASGTVISVSMPTTRPVTSSRTGASLKPVVRSLALVNCRWGPLPSVSDSTSLRCRGSPVPGSRRRGRRVRACGRRRGGAVGRCCSMRAGLELRDHSPMFQRCSKPSSSSDQWSGPFHRGRQASSARMVSSGSASALFQALAGSPVSHADVTRPDWWISMPLFVRRQNRRPGMPWTSPPGS